MTYSKDKNREKDVLPDSAGFITKASEYYCNKFFLRGAIQSIPNIGVALDTLLSGLGAKYQSERLKDFIFVKKRR